MPHTAQTFLNLIIVFHYTLSSFNGSLDPSGQSDNNPTIVNQVIVQRARSGLIEILSGMSRPYFVNLYSFTPLPKWILSSPLSVLVAETNTQCRGGQKRIKFENLEKGSTIHCHMEHLKGINILLFFM